MKKNCRMVIIFIFLMSSLSCYGCFKYLFACCYVKESSIEEFLVASREKRAKSVVATIGGDPMLFDSKEAADAEKLRYVMQDDPRMSEQKSSCWTSCFGFKKHKDKKSS